MTFLDLIENALRDENLLPLGQSADADTANFCLQKLNRLFDNWNAESLFIFGTTLFQGTLTPNHNPHTMSTSGADFTVSTARPPKVLSANLVLTDVTPNIYRPLRIVDDDWWMANPVPTIATQVPYYLWPNYSWPTMSLYLWPVPTTAYDIRLDLWTLFSQVTLATSFSMPPGYQDAVTLSLAEAVCPALAGRPASESTIEAARMARGRVKSLNSEAPEMKCDPGVQSLDSRPTASIANMLSGFFN